jgi:hypothetical protein
MKKACQPGDAAGRFFIFLTILFISAGYILGGGQPRVEGAWRQIPSVRTSLVRQDFCPACGTEKGRACFFVPLMGRMHVGELIEVTVKPRRGLKV